MLDTYHVANIIASECYWGNIPAYNTSENIGDCNAVCAGDVTEICGGGNRILIYQDSAWVLLTDAEYAEQLQELQSLLQQLETLVAKWQQDLLTYYNAIQAATQNKRRRTSVSLSQLGATVNLDQEAILAILKPRTISKCALCIRFSLPSYFFYQHRILSLMFIIIELKLLSLDYFIKIKIGQAQKVSFHAPFLVITTESFYRNDPN